MDGYRVLVRLRLSEILSPSELSYWQQVHSLMVMVSLLEQ